MNNRLKNMRKLLVQNSVDAVLVTQAENRRYLSGFDGSAGYLLITEQKAILATDFRYTEQASEQAPDFEITRIKGKVSEWFPDLVAGAGVKKLGFEADDISYNAYKQYSDALAEIEIVPVSGVVEKLRAVKEPEEIEYIEKAVAIADAAYNKVSNEIKAGMTEKQVAWEMEKSLRENGSEAVPFEIIVASGPNAALPHHRPTDRVINGGEPVLIDMGAKYKGYASDLSRTIYLGAPDDRFIDIYKTVLDAQEAAESIIKSGMTVHQADSAAREVIEKAGYGELFGHSLGHGVGLAEHELPHLSPNAGGTLENGMVYTVEPGIYLSGWGGVRIEDTTVMENGKTRVISKARKVRYD
jgi:Xaa-Pro aminopeptidase